MRNILASDNQVTTNDNGDPSLKERFFDFDAADASPELGNVPMYPVLDWGHKVERHDADKPLATVQNVSQIDIGDEPVTSVPGTVIDISDEQPNIFTDAQYASLKAEKFNFALGEDSPGKDQVQALLENGDDNDLRGAMADKKALELQNERINQIRGRLQSQQNLTPEQIDEIVFLSKAKPDVDPATILEELYGNRFTTQVTQLPANVDNFRKAIAQASDETLDGLDAVASMVAKREMTNDILRDLETKKAEQTSWGSVKDFAKQFLPLHSYGNLSGTAQGEAQGYAARGRDRESNYEYFRTLNPSRFKREFTAAYQRIAESSLLDAQSFVEGYLQYSSTDATMDDVLGYLDWAAVPGLARFGAEVVGSARRFAKPRLGRGGEAPEGPLSSAPTPSSSSATSGFDDITVVPTDGPVTTTKSGTAVPFGYDPKSKTLSVWPEGIKEQWDFKPWRKNNIDDAEFPTPDDWYSFVVQRQLVKPFIPRKLYKDRKSYNEAVDQATFGTMKSAEVNQMTKQILKDTQKAAEQPTVEDAVAQVGDIDMAAAILTHKRMKETWDGLDPLGDSVELKNRTPSLFYPHEPFSNPGSLAVKQVERLKARAMQSAAKLLSIPTNNVGITRMTPEATQAAIDIAKKRMVHDYDRVSDAVLDADFGGAFRVIRPEDQAVNVYTLEYRLGKITRKVQKESKSSTPKAPDQSVSREPPVSKGMVRVYHSGSQGDGKSKRWVSTNRAYGENYREGAPAFYTDLPANDPRLVNADYPEQSVAKGFTFNFELTEKEAAGLKPLGGATQSPPTGPAKTGDELLDNINKYTAANGRMLLKDIYDQMKRDGVYKGNLAEFRKAVAAYASGKKVNTSFHEGKLPPQSPPRKVAPISKASTPVESPSVFESTLLDLVKGRGEPSVGFGELKAKFPDMSPKEFQDTLEGLQRSGKVVLLDKSKPSPADRAAGFKFNGVADRTGLYVDKAKFGSVPESPMDRLAKEVVTDKGYFDLAELQDTLKKDKAARDREIATYRADDDEDFFKGKSDAALIAFKHNDDPDGSNFGAVSQMVEALKAKQKKPVTEGQVQKILDYANGKRTLETKPVQGELNLEEGNFASEFRRDIGYGSETHRNRIIDSEIVYKPATKYTSARRFHYIEPPEGFPVKKDAPTAPKVFLGGPKADPKRVSDLDSAVADLLSKLRKAPNPRLHDRLTKLQARLEVRAKRGLGEDIRGPGEGMNTSPYQEQYSSLSRRKFTDKDGKTTEQIELSDVDRTAPKDRALTIPERDRFRKLEAEVNDHLASMAAKRPKREEPYVAEVKMGKPTAELFKSRSQAANYGTRLYGLSPREFKIMQQGSGFYISIPRVVDETQDVARSLMVTTSNRTDNGIVNAFAGYILTPDGQMSELANANRKLATYAPGEMHRLWQEAADEIRTLPRAERKELVELWKANRDWEGVDKEGNPIRGQFHDNVYELEAAFQKRFKKLPSEGQVGAYFEYLRLYDTDYVLRNLALHRDVGRLGLEKTRLFTHFDNDGQTDIMPSRWFASKEIDKLPLGEQGEDWGVFIYDDSAKGGQFHLRSQLTKDILDDIHDKQTNHGYKLLEMGNPLEKPLRSVVGNDETVNFALVKNFEKVKYDWAILPKRPGGHVDYDMKYFTKQPRIRRSDASGVNRNIYEGDTALLAHDTEAEAKQLSEAVERARQMLRQGTPDDVLEDFLHKHTPFDLDQWKAFFKERQGKNGEIIPPKYNIDDPFTHTFSGRNTFDMDHFKAKAEEYPNFVDAIRSKYNIFANGVDKKYLGARDPDLPAVDIGDGERPYMALAKPRLIDPLDSLNSSMANAIRSRYLNDLKVFHTESFIEEFANVMDLSKVSKADLRRNPVYYLHNPVWDTELSNFGQLQAAKNYRRAALNLLGTDSWIGEFVKWSQEKMVSSVYNAKGQKAAEFVTAKKLLPSEVDPVKYARGMAFHEKLGLYNVKQFFTQAQSIANVAAIEGPVVAMQALPKMIAARWLALTEDENVIRGVAAKFGLDQGDFLESYAELKKTGFYNVGGETSAKDDFFDPQLIQGPVGKFLEWGTTFFKEGERAARLTAWFAAFSNWRVKNPTKVLTNSDRALILNRADMLMTNQSRASNSTIQHGIGSVPTQFWSYQWRLSELILGKRLTTSERLRLITTQAAMYGIPIGLSAAVAVPFYDTFRQAALERGINMDDKQIQAFHDGLVSTAISAATGEQYNFSQTYGPGGLSIIKEIANGDKTLVDLVIGASGQVALDNIKALGTGVEYLHSLFTFDQKDGPTMADILDVTKNISSVNSLLQAWSMYNTGRYITKNGNVLIKDATATDAFMQAFFGLQKNEVGDTMRMINSMEQQKEFEEKYRKEVLKYYRQSMHYRADGNDKEADVALKKAQAALVAGGFRPDQFGEIAKRAASQNESLFESMQKKFVKQAPPSQYQQRLEEAIEYKKRNYDPTKGQ